MTKYTVPIQQAGFTLVELLVVIFIIGILAALLVTNLAGIRSRAEDSQAKADLGELKKALRIYYNDYQAYPSDSSGAIIGCGASGTTICSDSFSNGSDTVYMKDLPENMSYYSDGDEEFLAVIELNNASDQDISKSQAACSPDSRIYYTDGPIGATEYVVCTD
ncbi:prepilin-type N-terminal cleavage/methylation domain-containing protein [Patescibacteria group bacterium]|nr:prepilin-type N-terminal cleavage/methylation domain-containing protein [Patescibacteria group bacterium]MBU1966854.1 prepilin-type N-terminal cleavage/methylation domain-containing protein [Patescibacteria group bacterium]MBU2543675.1 prepilin-type N-terminal cleavage/methylation domain-containing protein [Patescibacteria group bacterium]